MNIIVRRHLVCVATLLLLSYTAASEAEETRAAEPLRANVESVEDHRSSTMTSTCQVRLTLLADDIDETTRVIDTKLTRAIDDTDRDLIPKPGSAASRYSSLRSMFTISGPLRSSIALRSPARRATVIKTIEGVVQLQTPTEANEGMVTISDPLANPGAAFKQATLDKYGIQITYITEDTAAALRQTTAPEEEQRRLEAVAAEVARRRGEREAAMPELATTPTLSELSPVLPASRVTVQSSSARSREMVSFKIEDPNNKLVALEWCDAKGVPLRMIVPMMTSRQVRSFSPRQKIPAGAQLVVYVASDGSVTSRPFKLENIALP